MVRAALRFSQVEAAGGIVMVFAAVVALLWANGPWYGGYRAFLATPVALRFGHFVHLDLDLHGAINDGLMTLFFLVAGLEIKRQLVVGELRDRRAAALPALAALGGMVVPVALYAAMNAGHAGSRGWGIPVATDIAFAVGVVALAGSRLPVGARVFLLTLAVVDDVGGIVVIAVFYAKDVRLVWLAAAALSVVLTLVAQRFEVRSAVPYYGLGLLCWYALHRAGVEAAIAGVVFALLTPVESPHDSDRRSPLEQIESHLNPWVSFLVVPLFALTNAGVRVDTSALDARVVIGVAVGLVAGKTIGVFGATWLAVRLGVGRVPEGATWRQMLGLAVTAGIGFTVALFVTGLAFTEPALVASAKLAIIGASVVAGVGGYLLLRGGARPSEQPAEAAGSR